MTTLQAFDCDSYLAVRVRSDAPAPERHLRIAFLLDVSDSMSGERLTAVKRTLHAARPLFKDTDRMTVITFGDSAHLLSRDHVMDAEGLDTFYSAIDAIITNGCTNLSSALEMLHGLRGTWDAVLLLTDGMINMGLTSTSGLTAMAKGIGPMPYYTLGYGADHNRQLLRDLSLGSRGSYTFVDSDEMLPVAMADTITGLRTEVLRDAVITVPDDCVCQEVGTEPSRTALYKVGGVVPGRDYWAIFTGWTGGEVRLTANTYGSGSFVLTESVQVAANTTEVREQIWRCRVAQAMADATQARNAAALLRALKTDMDNIIGDLKDRPFMLRMRGQIAELLDSMEQAQARAPTIWVPPDADTTTRLFSNVVYYANQRGTQAVDDPTNFFASPTQRVSSQTCRANYSSQTE
jgi:hypothetical protein